MTTRTYVNHLTRINDRELPFLPPFSMNQSLHEEELKDKIHKGLPVVWKIDMTHQGFDCFVSPLEQMIHFCERMEATPNSPIPAKSTGNNDVKPTSHNGKQKSNKWCEYHENTTHNTRDCTTLIKLKARRRHNDGRFKQDWKPKISMQQSGNNRSHRDDPTSTLLQKSQKVFKQAKHELQMLSQAVEKAVKRKSVIKKKTKDSSSDSDACDQELCTMDSMLADISKHHPKIKEDDNSSQMSA